jgi:hypothetical protein
VELQYEKGTPNIKPAKEKQLKRIGTDKDGKAIFEPET